MSTDLTIYGNRPEVQELGDRVKRFLPGGANMTAEEALGFAQISIAQNLNPFAREIWYIPGIGTVTGIEGYRKMAKRQAHYNAQTRVMTPEEQDAHQLNDGDIGAACELYRPDVIMAAVEVNKAAGKIVIPIIPVIGTGIRRAGEKRLPKGRSALWVAEKRAEADALRKAFDLGIAYDDNGTTVLSGEVEELPDWAVTETEKEEPETVLARNRTLLHGDEPASEIIDAEEGGPAEEPATASTRGGEPEAEEEERPPANGQWSRPMNPANTRYSLRFRGGWVQGQDPYFADARRPPDTEQQPPDERLVQRIAAMMGKALTRPEGGDTDLERHLVLSWTFDVESTGLLTALEAQATAKWLEAFPAGQGADGTNAWIPSGVASDECKMILHQAMKDRGQHEMDLGEGEDA